MNLGSFSDWIGTKVESQGLDGCRRVGTKLCGRLKRSFLSELPFGYELVWNFPKPLCFYVYGLLIWCFSTHLQYLCFI